jgi:hypothetical protein
MGGGNDDLSRTDPGILSRAPCERPPDRSHLNPGAFGRPPGPISAEDLRELDALGWIPHPPLPPPVPIEQLVRQKIVELALGEVTRGNPQSPAGVAAQVADPKGGAPQGKTFRAGWSCLLEYFHTAQGSQAACASDDLIKFLPSANDTLPDWCGIFTVWAIKTACKAFPGQPVPAPKQPGDWDWAPGGFRHTGKDPFFRLQGPREVGEPGDIGYKEIPKVNPKTGAKYVDHHFFLVHSVAHEVDKDGKKTTKVYAIDGNSYYGAVTTSWPSAKNAAITSGDGYDYSGLSFFTIPF